MNWFQIRQGKKIMEYTFVVIQWGILFNELKKLWTEWNWHNWFSEGIQQWFAHKRKTIQKLDVQYSYEYAESGKLIKTGNSMQKGRMDFKKIISNEYDNRGRITRQVEKLVEIPNILNPFFWQIDQLWCKWKLVDEVEKHLHPDHLLRMMAIFTIRMGRLVIYKAWTVQMEHQKSSGTMIRGNWSANDILCLRH